MLLRDLFTRVVDPGPTLAGHLTTARRLIMMGRWLLFLALLLIWAGHPASEPAAQTPPQEDEAYYSGGIVEFVGPLLRPVPAAKLFALRPPGPAVQEIGSGELTFAVDDTVDPAYEQYTLDLLETVYPVIVELYGQPSHTLQVTVHFDDSYPNWFFYNSVVDQIVISSYPDIKLPYDPGNPNDPGWDGILTHELIHAFHDSVFLFASWPEEGMTEAATELVADRLLDLGIRDIRQRVAQTNILMSDTWNEMGADTLGGTTYSYYKALPDLFYRAAPALFWKLTTSQSETATRDWPGYDFLKQLNQALYDYAENTSTYVSESAFLSIIETIATQPVDGMPARAWLESQPITNISGEAGTFLGVYPSRSVLPAGDVWIKTPTNPERIYAFAFERTVEQNSWDTRETLLKNGDVVSFVIENASGAQVYVGNIVLDRTWAYASIDTSGWPAGAYRIRAEAMIKGEYLTADNVFIVGPSVVSTADGVGVILTDGDGNLLSQPAVAQGGTLILNGNAAAIVVPEDVSHLPQTPAVNQQAINLPLPYTRVWPLRVACQAPASDVSGDGLVDIADLQLVAGNWRTTDAASDLNTDGRVDVRDILTVASGLGAGCPGGAPEEQIAQAPPPEGGGKMEAPEPVTGVGEAVPWETSRALILAQYRAGFRTPEFSGQWQGWNWDPDGDGGQDEGDHIPDRIGPDGRPDLTAAHQPLIGAYDSSDPAVVEYQIASAWAAGIDGFIAQWPGSHDRQGIDEALGVVFDSVARLREQYGLQFHMLIAYDEQVLRDVAPEDRAATAIEHMRYLLDRYASQSSYLTYEGIPLVLFNASQAEGTPGLLRPHQLANLKAALPDFYLVRTADPPTLDSVAGFFSWVSGTHEEAGDGGPNWVTGAGRSAKDSGAGSANWVYPDAGALADDLPISIGRVWPGLDNSKVWDWATGDTPHFVDRRDGAVYRLTWDAALHMQAAQQAPGLIQIMTWNDWNAGTEIEPSVEYGRFYLEDTQQFAKLYTGRAMSPSALLVPEEILWARRNLPGSETEAVIDEAYRFFFAGQFDAALAILQAAALVPEQ